MLYFLNPGDLLIPNMMIDTSPWSSCSRWSPWSPWLPCSSQTISFYNKFILTFLDMDLRRSEFTFPRFEFIIYGKLPFHYTYGFWKEPMISRLSNLINRNRSAAKISQVLCSNHNPPRLTCHFKFGSKLIY